uniref:SFRICE_016408 n=1 Tax=Spodoptera frugiperda TaxID=7108 RepID=A0A2H1WET0_SPOFR
MNRIPLYEEYRLIERSENEINGAWKGAHLLLFFLAFVFGSFCTFCFHMLMYLFDEKCVLFPKLLSLTSHKHNVIYEFMPAAKDLGDLPVDFLSTQWVEKSTCSLPTYMPLVSGIFGLVWTTMFLMCSTGSRTLTGLQRPWRVLPPVFVFSLAMGGLCVYSSAITHYGLQELCVKLGEITGSPTCSYTINIATLTYERRIRGVYQATRLTILSAWLHTFCWLFSAVLALVRVLLAVDFQLVRVSVHLHGDIDSILEKHEVQIRTVSPETWFNEKEESPSDTKLPIKLQQMPLKSILRAEEGSAALPVQESELLYLTQHDLDHLPSMMYDLVTPVASPETPEKVPEDKSTFEWLKNLLGDLILSSTSGKSFKFPYSFYSVENESRSKEISRQFAQEEIFEPEVETTPHRRDSLMLRDIQKAKRSKKDLVSFDDDINPRPSTSKEPTAYVSEMDITADKQSKLDNDGASNKTEEQTKEAISKDQNGKKSNLKTIAIQTEKRKDKKRTRVQIPETNFVQIKSDSDQQTSTTTDKKDVDKETQTKEKEKQD